MGDERQGRSGGTLEGVRIVSAPPRERPDTRPEISSNTLAHGRLLLGPELEAMPQGASQYYSTLLPEVTKLQRHLLRADSSAACNTIRRSLL